MISFRQHLVSLVAVFLALAVGVVLGGGPLSELGREGDTAKASARTDAKTRSLATADAFADTFAEATAARTLGNGLDGQTVVLLAMPGADEAAISGASDLVRTAGGAVVGQYAVQQSLVDPQEKTLVDTLGSQLVTSLKDVQMPADATTYVRIGRLLGLSVGTKAAAGAATSQVSTSIGESLAGADLLTRTSGTRRGALALLVLGNEPDPDAGVDVIVSGLVTGLSQVTEGVVVAGTSTSGQSGLLSAVRDDPTAAAAASTTDSVQTGVGQVTAVLALVAAAEGTVGSFGASGSDGAVPLG